VQANRVMFQDKFSATEYWSFMMDEIDDRPESHLVALREIEKEKLKVVRQEKLKVVKLYNKRVKEKSFQVGDLVWKMMGARDRRFGKWSPSWEGPFTVTRVVPGNAYFMETMKGKYLKRFYPCMWQGA
jgi:hypothetical protein